MKRTKELITPSRGCHVNSGTGVTLQPVDIGHSSYVAMVDPDTAFWALVRRGKVGSFLSGNETLDSYRRKSKRFREEIDTLRFGLKPSAVYFNPTSRCNLDCVYCYIPRKMRRSGPQMSRARLFKALSKLKRYFKRTLPEGRLPRIIFHGAEPMLSRDHIFEAMDRFEDDFAFGVQTNATLLDREAVEFLTKRRISIGISLDGPVASVADRTRFTWKHEGVYSKVIEAMEMLRGYDAWSVISTVSSRNMRMLTELVDFLHGQEVPTCMLNPLRCTLPGARGVKPSDGTMAKYIFAALDETHRLYRKTGRKLVVANFANIILAIVAPSARRLMCDISPCTYDFSW